MTRLDDEVCGADFLEALRDTTLGHVAETLDPYDRRRIEEAFDDVVERIGQTEEVTRLEERILDLEETIETLKLEQTDTERERREAVEVLRRISRVLDTHEDKDAVVTQIAGILRLYDRDL
jgi:hypothetical protein